MGLDRQTYMELQGRDEGYRREREGVELGLAVAIDLVEQVEAEQAAGRSSASTEASEISSNARPQRLFTHAGTLVKKEAPSRQDDRTPTEVSEVSSHASPPRILAHAGTLVKEEAPSCQDVSTPDSQDRRCSPKRPLGPPGPRLTGPHLAQPRPARASGGSGGVDSRPGSCSLSEDRRRPAKITTTGGERRNQCISQDQHQVVIGPSKRRNVHRSEQGASSREAGPPIPISPPGWLASGRSRRPPHNRQSTTESEDLLAGFKEVGDGHLEAYAVSFGRGAGGAKLLCRPG